MNFSTQKTMRIAQQLYEGVDVKGSGTVGLITYLRTDSTRIAEEADEGSTRLYRCTTYGEELRMCQQDTDQENQRQRFRMPMRPSVRRIISRTPAMVKDSLTRDQFRLYQLIWKRFAASRMAAAVYETTSVKIGRQESTVYHVAASRLSFDGFMSVYVQAG
ncbi:MAG: DNA topoisomerase [Clostridium sp.]